ncbi:MAG: ABC transporter ATP-binding protein [Candidatus Methanomethylophilus sp.]|nr:ABC transporter ATP-binding protein [Methanomethylophilus sp.]MDD4222144.1 ABC transporter ATP-binding protein [Methanomethylophilus sp.]
MVTIEEVQNLSFYYDKKQVLDKITMCIQKGEFLSVIGPNGCGKTTLLKNLNKNLQPRGGCVLLSGEDLATLTKKEIAQHIAVVPQGNEVRFAFTVRDIVAMGRMPFQGNFDPESRKDAFTVDEALIKTGLVAYADRYINEMSGGERQRVIIARALTQTPQILLLDEPTLHLDVSTQFDILDMVYNLAKSEKLTVVMISHDLPMVARYSDRVIMIHDHQVLCEGTVDETLTADNMKIVFGVDAELGLDSKTGRKTVFVHGSVH